MTFQDWTFLLKPTRDGRPPPVSGIKSSIKLLALALESSGYIERRIQNRRFIVSKRLKYMGLCNTHTEEGDVIVVLDGMEVPLILRKGADDDFYTVIGEACKCLKTFSTLRTSKTRKPSLRLPFDLRYPWHHGEWRGFRGTRCRYSDLRAAIDSRLHTFKRLYPFQSHRKLGALAGVMIS